MELPNQRPSPAIIKSGMLADAADTVADLLASHPTIPYICDPVLRSTSDTPLLSEEALSILQKRHYPTCHATHPNLPEARKLTGLPNASPQELAAALLEIGAQAVLLKGGHADGDSLLRSIYGCLPPLLYGKSAHKHPRYPWNRVHIGFGNRSRIRPG